ncbi:hypothetical protein RJT34_15815 [Clitoria ternatea]|uniref:Uncharacterized protein n=1 Tax=Clitoria ternatea TaxID=43366 RepID=A0AAN9J6C9_CLITE
MKSEKRQENVLFLFFSKRRMSFIKCRSAPLEESLKPSPFTKPLRFLSPRGGRDVPSPLVLVAFEIVKTPFDHGESFAGQRTEYELFRKDYASFEVEESANSTKVIEKGSISSDKPSK